MMRPPRNSHGLLGWITTTIHVVLESSQTILLEGYVPPYVLA